MLQLLHLDASKVYRVLHMGCAWETAGDTNDARGGAGNVWGGVGNVRSGVGPLLVCLLTPCAGNIRTLAPGSDFRTLANSFLLYSPFIPK
jgi:hypothetical protein